jgi:hypothetical protein
MAKDAKPATEGADAAPAKNSKKLLIIITASGAGPRPRRADRLPATLRRRVGMHEDDGEEAVVEKAKPAKKKKVTRARRPSTSPSMPSRSISYRTW